MMAGWDGDALAGSMEEALGRQQEVAEGAADEEGYLFPARA